MACTIVQINKMFSNKYIPDDGPKGAKILLVGEAPGGTEVEEGKPFVGESGRILMDCLGRHGISRSDIRLTNLCHYRPDKNDFKLLLNTNELKNGLAELYSYIAEYRPTVIGALGAFPLQFLTGKKGIKKWRGSILSYMFDETIKVIPTIHPAAVLRESVLYPTFDLDIKRIINDANYPERRLPVRQFIIDPRGLELEEWTERLCNATYLGTDIETVKNSSKILCVGFAPSAEIAVCINAESEEGRRAIGRILSSDVDKIFQFGTFDTIQLIELNHYEFNPGKIAAECSRPYYWDTLVAQHILAPELPRSLEYLTSVYTREPYYKTVGRGTIPDDEKGWSDRIERQPLYEYNCRDCACTIEIALQQMQEIADGGIAVQNMFQFEMEMVGVACHISNAGMQIDEGRRQLIEDIMLDKWVRKQAVLNILCQTGAEVNVRSPKLKNVLYEHLGLPPRYKDKRLTTDEDAIVSLIAFCKEKADALKTPDAKLKWDIRLNVCKLILEIRGIRVVLSNYVRKIQKNKIPRCRGDSRIHSTYKAAATETGRWSCSKYVDGTGFNAQTLPRDPIEYDESQLTNKGAQVILDVLDEDEIEETEENEEAA